MKFNIYTSRYFPVAFLFRIFPKKIRKLSSLASTFVLFISILFFVFGKNAIGGYNNFLLGLFFSALAIRLFLFMTNSFLRDFLSGRHQTVYSLQKTAAKNAFDIFNFEAFYFVYSAKSRDSFGLISNFLNFNIMRGVLLRCGISPREFLQFIKEYDRLKVVSLDKIMEKALSKALNAKRTFVKISDVALAAFEADSELQKFLFSWKIKQQDWEAVLKWMDSVFEEAEQNAAWWRADNLLRTSPFAKNFAYGFSYELEKYASDLTERLGGLKNHVHLFGRKKEIDSLSRTLLRSSETNALLVGEAGVGKETILLGFAKLIAEGTLPAPLKYKRVMEFNFPAFLADCREPSEFEHRLIKILNETESAGNVILVIENLPDFFESAKAAFKLNPERIFEPYFLSQNIQFIALSDKDSFLRIKDVSSSFSKFFEIIFVEEPDEKTLEKILEDNALHLEVRTKVVIAYSAIKEVLNSSNRYITEGVQPERAIDLLEEVVSKKEKTGAGYSLINSEDVFALVREKTKIPLGEIGGKEKEIFLNLEEKLHQRVVNQEEAISYLAESLRRSRVGIQNPNRPIGSFLFLGPTGVGKTETAKALANVYFGSEERMIRLDMSEYSREDGLPKLIGSPEGNIKGRLSEFIREEPYILLLLDELEKAHYKVGNLFLQILEDGFFTDGLGKKVNMRNAIIIATSNAGSSLIWEAVKRGAPDAALKEKVIDKIRLEGFFSPELLNRFDGIIVFKPLTLEHLKKIALLLLNNLSKRVAKEQDIYLNFNESVVDFIAARGHNPQFGARPIRRLIQDKIESMLAKKIISEEIKRGDKAIIGAVQGNLEINIAKN